MLQETILVWATSNDEEKQLQAEEDIEELLDRHEEEEARQSPGEHKLHNPDDPEEGRKEEEDDTAGSEAVSREDQRLIKKLHVNLGHPSNQELCRALRIARARNSVWRYVKDSFKCEECERNKKPRSARPAVIPRSMEPCKTVGLDVVFFPALDVRQVRPVLNMVDWATGYQMLEPLENTQSNRDSDRSGKRVQQGACRKGLRIRSSSQSDRGKGPVATRPHGATWRTRQGGVREVERKCSSHE